ncbi:MAG: DGQHR domain-containing protein [Candidatus Aenigmarchaeota archaeon]|nr:DGQHR domain-containing protein [Candidatus Aenigmarchaeota archaeon]
MQNLKTKESSGWVRFKALEAKQPGGTLYTIVMKGKDLVSKSRVLTRDKDDEGVQRILSKARCRRIARFYAMDDTLLPGNIVSTIDNNDVRIEDGHVQISKDFINEVIDGQHRLWGFDPEYNEQGTDFDVILTFLIGADVQTKAKLFYKINKEQKKINPSLAYDLLIVMGSDELKAEIAKVVQDLNEDKESAFYGTIKIRETSEGTISMATMAHKIEQFLKGPMGKRFLDREELNKQVLYDVLRNYFTAVKNLLPDAWSDSNCILVKSLGCGALIELLPDVISEHTSRNGRTVPTVKQFVEIMKPVSSFDFYDQEVTNLGGEKGQRYLANLLVEEIGIGGFEVGK